ncbi:MAG: hypothetical protein IJP86_08535 [Synergistaceae bacterium]|nr:hypothetical protein [Synergistaceae bacterium]
MRIISEYEDIMARLQSEGKPYWAVKDDEANYTMLKAYFNSKKDGKELLDFNDIIWDKDIKAIAEAVRRFGIKEFTISVFATGIADALAAFQEAGIRIQGMIKAETDIRTSHWDERGRRIKSSNTINALLMKVE